jgi:hypothetical protein
MNKDEKMEKIIQNIKESKNSSNKLLYYKKANIRLVELKTKYNKLCEALKKPKTKPSDKPDNKISIEKIITELDKIYEQTENKNCDMLELIDNYVQYKLLLDNLEIESDKIKNEIFKVNNDKNKITIEKMDIKEIL